MTWLVLFVLPFVLLGLAMLFAEAQDRRRWKTRRQRDELQRTISKLMDDLKEDQPETRRWLEAQLHLLDLEYDPHHWITMEWVR